MNNIKISDMIYVTFYVLSRLFRCTLILFTGVFYMFLFSVKFWINLYTKKFSNINPLNAYIVNKYINILGQFIHCGENHVISLITLSDNLLHRSHSSMFTRSSLINSVNSLRFLPVKIYWYHQQTIGEGYFLILLLNHLFKSERVKDLI